MTNNNKKGFGLWSECPDSAVAAWGARTIVEKSGSFSILHDRQDWFGDEESRVKLRGILNSSALKDANAKTVKLFESGSMRNDESRLFTLYDDGVVTIKGNTNSSFGYLYIIAYMDGSP